MPSFTPPGLYIVATPIGNLGDITLRALETLKIADLIVCEDTRVTGVLLRHYGIQAPMWAYNDHNAASVRPNILKRIQEGGVVAFTSDAGTPLVSDPGYKLVREAVAEGLHVSTLPGACAPIAALTLAGLPTDTFTFLGFPPHTAIKRQSFYGRWRSVPSSLVVLESPQRIIASVSDALQVLGDRPAAIGRELTKAFEEVLRGTFSALIPRLEAHHALKGEITMVIGPAGEEEVHDPTTLLRELLANHSLKDAVANAMAATGLPRQQIYPLALKLKEEGPRES